MEPMVWVEEAAVAAARQEAVQGVAGVEEDSRGNI